MVALYGVEPLGDEPAYDPPLGIEDETDEVAAAFEAQSARAEAAFALERAAFEARKLALLNAHELERVKWDRIAKSGYVPVNIAAVAEDVGKYLVPVDDGSGGVTAALVNESDLTLICGAHTA